MIIAQPVTRREVSMRSRFPLIILLLALGAAVPPSAAEPPAGRPAVHDELSRSLDELASQLHGLTDRWRGHFGRGEAPGERPLITLMLGWRQELGLSAAQIESLERLRTEFQRGAIRRDADLRVAEMDLAALLRTDTVDLAAAEAKVREIERLRAETRLARIRAIEEGKAQLTVEQRATLRTLLAQQAARPPEPPVRRSR
ncbi:MAG: periplasmic heavy metal sensor [Candidatus Rokubacteria bacterium]|nr:periplasmic heavy metal sensor [Candidatus Rokubacteria bacterium]